MIVGYTGFVGSNLCLSHDFTHRINSKNIETAYGVRPETLFYCGVPAEMYLANRFPAEDRAVIETAERNIARIGAKQVVLISTVAVYDRTKQVDENYEPSPEQLPPYGQNRLALERWVERHCERHLIVRLPAIYGEGLKKNFIYDILHEIPAKLTEQLYAQFAVQSEAVAQSYAPLGNGYYALKTLDAEERRTLLAVFRSLGFTALHFTDSRSVYQFFWLRELYGRITDCLARGIQRVNLATPPIGAGELYESLTGRPFVNEKSGTPFDYDIRTKYTDSGYWITRTEELSQIRQFVERKQTEQQDA